MTTPLETELTRTLAAAAEMGPAPAPDFFDEVRGRQRQRRQRRMTALGAAAVAVTVAIGFGAVRLLAGPVSPPESPASTLPPPTPPADRVPRVVGVRPAQEVWPEAVRTLPGRLPDGRRYTLAAILGDGRYLVAPIKTQGRADAAGELVQWEPATRSVTLLGRAAPSGRYTGMAVQGRVAVGDGHVAWVAVGVEKENTLSWGAGYQEIWVAPLGGTGHRVATVDGLAIGQKLQIVAGHVVWSQLDDAAGSGSGLYRVPLAGGASQRIPDSNGYVLTATAPWAEEGNENFSGAHQWNLADGTKRQVLAGDYSMFRCSPAWCVGRTHEDWHMFARRVDGSDAVTTDFTGDFYFTANEHVVMGHAPATGQASEVKRLLWDVSNGQTGTYPDQDYDPGKTNALGMPYWVTPRGELAVIDTSAIR
jgi:hypothetical protein